MRTRCLLPLLLISISLVFAGCTGKGTQAPPNILLIMADDVGREAIGCYGGSSYQTTNIDLLAGRGMKFDRVFSSPVCHPSRVALLTGMYPINLGDPDWGSFPVQAESKTFAQYLKNAGYRTAVAGKWQLTMLADEPNHPNRLGFEEYCLFGWHEGPRYHSPYIWENGRIREGLEDEYGPDIYSDFLVEFMRKNKDRPFLAYYPMALIHDVSDDLEVPPPYGPDGRYENVEEMMAELDRIVGKMMAALGELGLEENTIVLFTTDNGTNHTSIISYDEGEYLEEKVYSDFKGMKVPGGKKYFSDWGTRVPTIVVWPDRIKAGSFNNDLIDFTDFLPTILELAGVTLPDKKIDGRSFKAALFGENYEKRDWVFSQKKPGDGYMLRTEDWKLMWDGRLFDMENDPYEQNPIMADQDDALSGVARTRLDSITRSLVGQKRAVPRRSGTALK